VLVEAVNNAVRHGRAASIDLTLAAGTDPSTLHLTVDDDGIGPVQRPPGLGSALLDAMCDGDWGLARRPEGGSRLSAVLRLTAP
jgi:nitrate/nitrite-specific signal transduction histidine kinase